MRKPVDTCANKGEAQSVHHCRLTSAFIVCFLYNICTGIYKITILYLVFVGEQVGVRYTWVQTMKTDFLIMWMCVSY